MIYAGKSATIIIICSVLFVSDTKPAYAYIDPSTVSMFLQAGVGTAIHLGGPGALFWMWVSALLGMSFRMSSAFWAVKMARSDTESKLFATPMFYMVSFLSDR